MGTATTAAHAISMSSSSNASGAPTIATTTRVVQLATVTMALISHGRSYRLGITPPDVAGLLPAAQVVLDTGGHAVGWIRGALADRGAVRGGLGDRDAAVRVDDLPVGRGARLG